MITIIYIENGKPVQQDFTNRSEAFEYANSCYDAGLNITVCDESGEWIKISVWKQ